MSTGVMFSQPFVPQDHRSGWDPLPEGTYTLVVADTARQTTRAGDEMLVVKLEDTKSGQVANYRLNLWHSKADVREIARQQLGDLCVALGIDKLTDTAQMHGLEVAATVTHVTRGDYTNERFHWSPTG